MCTPQDLLFPSSFISSIMSHMKTLKHCCCTTLEMCTCPQIHEVAKGNKVSSLHPLWPYCWGSQEEDLILRLQNLSVDTQHLLQRHMNHRMLKHSLSKISHRSAQHSSWVQLQPRITPMWVCPQLFISASTLQCNLHKPSSIQVTHSNFTLGQGKGTGESFPFLSSTKYKLHFYRCWPQFFLPPIQVLRCAYVVSSHTCLFVMRSIYGNDKCGDNEGTKGYTDNYHYKKKQRNFIVQDEINGRGYSV